MRFTAMLVIVSCLASGCAEAGAAQVAVAANFAAPAGQLAASFERDTGHRLAIVTGSTGKFYAQIRAGAPFDVLLSADADTPQRLEAERLAVAGSRFAYALGRLVLWSPQAGRVDANGAVLRAVSFRRLAIANPELAPYGAAAREALQNLGLWSALQDRLVQGENIAQTYQFVATGNAELGFVALSQLPTAEHQQPGSRWLVPASLYHPIRQEAVLLAHGADSPAARAFLDYLKTPAARERIRRFGYALP